METDTGLGCWTWDDLAEAEPEEDGGGKPGNMLKHEEDRQWWLKQTPKIWAEGVAQRVH